MQPYRLGASVGFAPGDAGLPLLGSGWSAPDLAGFVWSDGPEASLAFALAPPSRDLVLRLEVMPFVLDDRPGLQRMFAYFNGFMLGMVELPSDRQEVQFTLPREYCILRTAQLMLHLPDCIAPAELGLSEDRRRLGIALWRFMISIAS